ncbi:DUF1840 domain-containing protein [Caenimonas koreensis]|uniref:DUF1840 family protein n=1 Tax=Caenimonas koreensis DSM 17982 TaxID=1121255 RepID=A0A844B6R7_9BURK|nr:DUF1840 domain-containing protein [Caenimonas koreensis]MRD48862.1 DUF1840 family protein [Caenimonas koreensis DSM 17982]
MLYKFKSKATGDLIMLEPNGKRVLQIIGKDAGPKGIVLPEEMPAAISALEAAIAQEAADQEKNKDDASCGAGEGVMLKQRALPFIDMLKRCAAEKEEIVWGV